MVGNSWMPNLIGSALSWARAEEEVAVERKVEERLQLVAAAEIVGEGAEPHVDLAEQDRVAAADGGEVLQLAQTLVGGTQARPGSTPIMVDQEGRGVDAEPGDAELEPEPHDRRNSSRTAGLAKLRSGWNG